MKTLTGGARFERRAILLLDGATAEGAVVTQQRRCCDVIIDGVAHRGRVERAAHTCMRDAKCAKGIRGRGLCAFPVKNGVSFQNILVQEFSKVWR